MTRRVYIVMAACLVAIAVVTAWRLWPATTKADNSNESVAAEQESLKRRAAEFLDARIESVTPVKSAASFESEAALRAANSDLIRIGLSEADARAAMAHASAMIHARFVIRDFDAYTAWRVENGYEFFPAAKLRQDPTYRDDVERVAGRRLRDDEHDTKDLWRLYWINGIAKGPRITGVDQTPDGVVMFAWKSSSGLAFRSAAPSRRAVESPILMTPPEAQGTRIGLWRGLNIGQGWPMWFPPADVEARLEQPGTVFIELAWVFALEGGEYQPFVIDLGMDRKTRRWWIMQWSLPHGERGIHIDAGGI